MLQALIINIKLSVPLGICSFDSLFCYSADNKRTNKTNLQMNEQNNQTQIDLWNQQKEYDYEMWNKENEYNTPANQVKRLQDAGINPALALSNISSGTATSSAGGQTPPQTTAGHVEPNWPETLARIQNLALVGKTFSDINKQNAETDALRKQNFWIDANNLAGLQEKGASTQFNTANALGKELENHFQRETFDERVGQFNQMGLKLNYETLKEKAAATLTENLSQHWKFVQEKLDPQQLNNLKAAYADAFASVALKYSNIEVNKANIVKVGHEVNNLVKQGKILDKTARQMDTDFYISDSTAGAMVNKLKSESGRASFDNSFGLFLDYIFKIPGMIK